MTETEKLLQDVFWIAQQLQNAPAKFEAAFAERATLKEAQQLVGDLFSLCEVIVEDG